MSRQSDKYHTSLAGEFFVAAQLQRLRVAASMTYGNAKSADVIVTNHATKKLVIVEVKSSSAGRWPVGSRVPEPSEQPWVFVYLPENSNDPPRFFILTQSELHAELKAKEDAYLARFEAKHNEPYGDRPGVAAATLKDIERFEDKWETILKQLTTPDGSE